MASLETFRGFVPVEMLERAPVERRPEQPASSGAGAVWGGGSSFSHSAQGRFRGDEGGGEGTRFRVVYPPEDAPTYKQVISVAPQINSQDVRVRHPEDPERFLTVTRYDRMHFEYSELKEKMRPGFQPVQRSVWRLAFALHPTGEAP